MSGWLEGEKAHCRQRRDDGSAIRTGPRGAVRVPAATSRPGARHVPPVLQRHPHVEVTLSENDAASAASFESKGRISISLRAAARRNCDIAARRSQDPSRFRESRPGLRFAPCGGMHAQPGAIVSVRGERWRLARVDAYERCSVLTLDGRDGANANRRVRVIEPFDRPMPVASGSTWCGESGAVVLRTALARDRTRSAGYRTVDRSWGLDRSARLSTRTGARGVARRDAVAARRRGRARQDHPGRIDPRRAARARLGGARARRCAPPACAPRGPRSCNSAFTSIAQVLDQSAIAETRGDTSARASTPGAATPPSSRRSISSSVPKCWRRCARCRSIVLIADEAHHLTPGTDRGSAVARLASRTPWCVLVSATPHSGDVAAFDYLTDLGSHRDPIAIFRRTRREARSGTRRDASA